MARKRSAGLLMYRIGESGLQVLLAHPGGPFWKNKDDGAWMIPKGEVEEGEDEMAAARREFQEETGFPAGDVLVPLGWVRQKSGKVVTAWGFEGDCDPTRLKSNTFQMEWPPKSGQKKEFPEIDGAEFWTMEEARRKMLPAEQPFLEALAKACAEREERKRQR